MKSRITRDRRSTVNSIVAFAACLALVGAAAGPSRASVVVGDELLRISRPGRVPVIYSGVPVTIEIGEIAGVVEFEGVHAPGLRVTGGSGETVVRLSGDLEIDGDLAIDINGRFEADTAASRGSISMVGRDSVHLAAPTIRLGDHGAAPLELRSGGDLFIQGSDLLDVEALGDPGTRIASVGDLILRSAQAVNGDAHWRAGRDLRIERLDGSPGDLRSPKDPVILTTRNVSLGAYTGASLHILAGGSVSSANITINGSDAAANTIGPGNTATFNGADTFADLANVVLSDGTVVAVDGAAEGTLDIRAGIDWSTFPGGPPVPDDQILPGGALSPTFGSPVTTADISLGTVGIVNIGGMVLLTNRFHANPGLTGLVSVGNIDTSVGIGGFDSGAVFIDSKNDVLAAQIVTNPLIVTEGLAMGSAGSVTVLAVGDLDLPLVHAQSLGITGYETGDGGDVTLKAGGRLLSPTEILTDSRSSLSSGNGGTVMVDVRGPASFTTISTSSEVSTAGDAGHGGDVTVVIRADGSPDGGEDLQITDVLTNAGSIFYPGVVGVSGNGGRVELRTEDGDIGVVERIWTPTVSGGGANPSGDGGDVVLQAVNGDIIIGLSYGDLGINTRTIAGAGSTGTTGVGGSVDLMADGDIVITPGAGGGGIITSTTGDNGEGGECGSVSIQSASGAIDLGIAGIQTDADGRAGVTGPGGAVDLIAGGPITTAFIDTSSFGRDGGSAAAGGAVVVNGGGAIATGNIDSRSQAVGPGGSAGDGGSVTTTTSAGTVSTGQILAFSIAPAGGGDSAAGGAIAVTAPGDLIVAPGAIYRSSSLSADGTAGSGGDISVVAAGAATGLGNVLTETSGATGSGHGGSVTIDAIGPLGLGLVRTSSWVTSVGAAGNGGNVQLDSRGPAGGITLTDALSSSGCWFYGGASCSAGSSGGVELTTETGDVVVSQEIYTHAIARGAGNSAGNGGNVGVIAPAGLISIGTTGIATRTESIGGGTGSAGFAGAVTLVAAGDITIAGAGINASARAVDGAAAGGGAVVIESTSGSIDLAGAVVSSTTYSATAGAGPGGSLQLSAAGSANPGNLLSSADAPSGPAGNGGNITLALGGSLLTTPAVSSYSKGATAAGHGGDIDTDVAGPASFGNVLTYSRSTGVGDTLTSGDIRVRVRNTGGLDGADDLTMNHLLADAGAWYYPAAVGSGGNAGAIDLLTEDGDILTTGTIFAFSGGRGPSASCGEGGVVTATATSGGISIGNGGINATTIIGSGSTGTAGRGGTIRLIADGDVVLPSTTNSTGLWATCTADDGVATGAGEIEVRSFGGAVDLGTKFFAARSNSANGQTGPGGTVIVNAATTITGGVIDVSSMSETGSAQWAGYVDVRAGGDIELSRIVGTTAGDVGSADGGLFVVDTGGLLRLVGGAVDQPTVDATGSPGTGWAVLSHGGGAAIPFTVGDATTNGSAFDVVTTEASIAPSAAFPQSHFEAPSVWILGDEPALLVNELDVDQPGTDNGEFIEVLNPFPDDMPMDLTYFDIVDGSGGFADVLFEPAIRGISVPANGRLVLCPTGSTLDACDYYEDFDLPNDGPAAVSIRITGIIEDVVSYEGDTPDGFTEGTGVGLEDPGATDHRSLSRTPDGVDTNHNANDFSLRCVSPGLPNLDATAGCTATGAAELNSLSASPAAIDEGGSVAVVGSFSEPPPAAAHTIEIEWGDGQTTTVPLAAGIGIFNESHVFGDNAFGVDSVVDIRVTVTDGTSTDEGWTAVEILNVPPTVDAGADLTAMVGDQVAFSGGFTDPGVLDTHTWLWTFGDGGSNSVTLTPMHTFTAPGAYTVTLEVVDDDGGIGSDSLVVDVAPAPPRVVALDTVARAGADGLSDGDGLANPVTSLVVTFSHAMLDPAGSASPVDVTNPANYRVVGAGVDGILSTFTCDPPSGDDVLLGLAGVEFNGAARTAVARVGGSGSIVEGRWRLILCAAGLSSTDGAALDGNGDGTGGDDLLLDFRVLRTENLTNPNFDQTLAGWIDASPPGSNFDSVAVDGEGSLWSGAAEAVNGSGAGAHLELGRCVELPPEAVVGITLRAMIDMAPAAADGSQAAAELRFFAGPGCSGTVMETRPASPVVADSGGFFLPVASPGRPPAGAVSAEVALVADADPVAPSVFTVGFDRISVAADGAIFEDGFEMGDALGWDSSTP